MSASRCRAVTRRIAGLLTVGLLLAACSEKPPRPNVLLVVIDDFGFNDLAINNASDSPTPRLDQIARDGIRFTRHYSESSCSPSRIALMTGRYPARFGFHPSGAGLPREADTLADILSANGYSSHFIGKWHAGDAHRLARPEFHGFAQWFGFMSQLYLAGPHDDKGYRTGRPTYRDPWLENERGELRRHRGHLTDLLTQRAVELIESAARPWFLQLAYYAVHTPLQPAARFAERYPADAAGRYQALKAQLDAAIGRLRDALRDSGQLANTMVVVVSDNGGTAQSWPSNLPFAGGKASYSEGGIRTPLILAWPGHWEGGVEDAQVVSIMDVYPTILAALGIPAPANLDGQDIFGARAARTLHWYSHNAFGDAYSALTADGEWRYSATLLDNATTEHLQHRSVLERADRVSTVPPPATLADRMARGKQRWLLDATELRDLAFRDSGDWREYSGDAFRRSPLLAEYSFGLPLRFSGADADAETTTLLAEQQGYLALSQRGNRLLIQFDGHDVEVALDGATGGCTTLALVGLLKKSNQVFFRPGNESILRVYLDGAMVAETRYSNARLNPASPENPLRVRIGTSRGLSMPAGAEPIISSRLLTGGEIARRLHPELLAACKQQSVAKK